MNWLFLHHFFFLIFSVFSSFSYVFASVLSSSSEHHNQDHDNNIIRSLPGFPGPLPFHLETGYIGVGSGEKKDVENDVQLFYYFLKSERNPKEDPILLWLTGGPGCSAFSDLVFLIGPLKFDVVEYNGSLPTLGLNPYSWTKVANIIFLDAPVGTGFSYSQSPEGSKTGDFKSCHQNYQFLRKWLIDHPEFVSNSLYVGGDSYSGMTVPLIVKLISDGIDAGNEPSINLKGYLVGNPITVQSLEDNSKIPFFHGMGLLSDELYKSLKKSCAGEYTNVDPSNTLCKQNLDAYSECVSGINFGHILEPLCDFTSPKPRNPKLYRRSLDDQYREFLDPTVPLLSFGTPPGPRGLECRSYAYLLLYYWINDESVRKALHIHEGSVPEWQRCNFGLPYKHEYSSSFPYHVILSQRGYRSLVYSGDHDSIVSHIGTQAWIRLLNYSIVDDWRSWSVDGQVGGYTRTYSNNMTFATVKGGGHTAPEYRPKECLAMFKRWIFNEFL